VDFLDDFAISRKLEGFFAKKPRDAAQPRATAARAPGATRTPESAEGGAKGAGFKKSDTKGIEEFELITYGRMVCSVAERMEAS
jgi:hypothetical protein